MSKRSVITGEAVMSDFVTVSASNTGEPNKMYAHTSIYVEPVIDKKKPKPKVKYVKLVPKMVVIECRCGGNLESFGGITKGMGPTMWKHKCPNCSTWYELKECAGSVIYE